jgi:hypothetical protein
VKVYNPAKVDRKEDFRNYAKMMAPRLLDGIESEYRFCGVLVGLGDGVRARLKKAGLQDWRFDFAWPEKKVAVEIDGGQHAYAGGRHNTDGDRLKINTATVMGWRVLRFSITALHDDPIGCIKKVKELLK